REDRRRRPPRGGCARALRPGGALRPVGWGCRREHLQRQGPPLSQSHARRVRLPQPGGADRRGGPGGDGRRDGRARRGGTTLSLEPDSAERVYQGRLLGLTVERWGENEREIVEHPGAVAVVAVDDEGCVALVRQLREATRKYLVELPAGTAEPGEA